MSVDLILKTYCSMDAAMKTELLRTVADLIKTNKSVVWNELSYHNIEDLRVDIEVYCKDRDAAASDKSQRIQKLLTEKYGQ